VTRTESTNLKSRLLQPTDLAWLAAFRVLFGLTLAVSMWRFIANDWITRFFVEPRFFFKYWGFGWVQPLSGPALHTLVVALGVLAVAVAAGVAFRASATLLALGLTYLQLLDVSTYLNHYYLAGLLCWLLVVSPAGRAWSVDNWFCRRVLGRPPASERAARAWLYLFRFQIALVYGFAALAKAQPDWLVHAQPLRIWLGASAELPLLGRLLAIDGVPLLMSWCGFLFDATVVGWLSWHRTRPYAYAVVLVFHALTRVLFPIGMFPVIMSVSALVFFGPSWPRALVSRLFSRRLDTPAPPSVHPAARPAFALYLGAAYCALQLLLPLRFVAYGGDVLWHEQGMRFSWRVMVRAKGGNATFLVRNKQTGQTWHVSPGEYLTPLQESEMVSQPDLILQLSHHIREDIERRGLGPVEVRVDARASLNGRRSAPIIDPRVDLALVSDGIALKPWILPAPASAPPHTRISL
jgi:vitamin K-dependent gamma-carboxylase